ncbi:MAG TPA: DMT family transporter [Chitinophagaceae bacterium]|nr:DMT family transporter [Chitinophagaceae bacterium]
MKKALINLHLAVFLAGFTGVLGRLISLNESLLVWYRLVITVITLALLSVIQGSFPRISGKGVLKIFGVGAVVAFHWVAFYGSVKYSNVSIALVCFSTLGFFSAVLEPYLLKKRISITEVLLGLLAILGVYCIFHFDSRYKTGILFGICSAVLAALFTILNKKALATYDAKTVTFYELLGGFLVLTMVLPAYLNFFNLDFSLPAAKDWLWLLILSWLCTVWAFYLSLTALKKISPFTVNLSYNLEPVYGIALAFVIYHENQDLGYSFYLGLSLIVLAVVLQMGRVYRGRYQVSGIRSQVLGDHVEAP